MRKIFSIFMVSVFLSAQPARADMFGGDVAVLIQILSNAVQQLYQLKQILQEGQDTLNLMKDINRGINDSLSVLDSISPYIDPGLYKELKKVAEVTKHIQGIYGVVVDSPEAQVQQNTDQTVAEAISLNNSIYDYTKELDKIGEEIKQYSHTVSPGGAAKLTAQSLGVMIHVMNEQLRASATGLKLQAQAIAAQNKKEKDATSQYLSQAQRLKSAMKSADIKFELPRF